MIDIHTHILPYVDDGSSDLETSINLIKSEINQGVTDIFVTPHYYQYRSFISSYEDNVVIFQQLKDAVQRLGLKVNLYLGNEIYYDQNTLKNLNDQTVVPLGSSKHVLVEFSMVTELEDIPEAINGLTAKGYVPIIAHPERYVYLNQVPEYRFLRKMGAKIQINAGSVTGYYGNRIKRMAFLLLKNELVDYVASDIHDFRPGTLSQAYEIISKKFSRETADRLCNNHDVFK